jgi:Na+/proline symporter
MKQLFAQATPVPVHYHHAWLIWILFGCGMVLHSFLQIDSMARKANLSRRAVFSKVLATLAYRTFAGAMIFGLLWLYPDMISKIAGMLGHALSPDEASVVAIPMNNFIAGIYGLFLDSALGYIPVLKSQLPSLPDPLAQKKP